MPRPRISISPASAGAGRTSSRPCAGFDMGAVVADQPREGQGALRRRLQQIASASRDLPEPDGPRISTALRRRPARRRRGWSAASRRHHIAGSRTTKRAPSTRGCFAGSGRTPLRFSAQMRAAMGLDDLLGDRQAEPGILPEALMRPVGVEALEDLLERVRADAGAVVVDHDLDLVLEPAAGDAHGAAGRRERARIVDQIVDHLAEPRIVARHHESRAGRRLRRRASR